MERLKQRRGSISSLELVLLIGIVGMVFFFVFEGFSFLESCWEHGNDRLTVNTAESVAYVNSNQGSECVVQGCSGGTCSHFNGSGYVGYFDVNRNTYVGMKPKGYNEQRVVKIQGKKVSGDIGTLVIRALVKDGKVELDWVKGK